MAVKSPLVLGSNGLVQQLQSGDVLSEGAGPLAVAAPATPSAGTVWLFSLVDFIPQMSSNTAPSGWVASASSEFSTQKAFQATYLTPNQSGVYGWVTNGTGLGGSGQWIKFQLPVAKVVKAYEIVPWSIDSWPNRVPTAWTLAGSNDDTNWTTLDTRSGEGPSTTFSVWRANVYSVVGNTTAYLYYRLTITGYSSGNAYIGLAALRLLGTDTPGDGSTGSKKPARIYLMDESGTIRVITTDLYR
jgi:hypothetical protein